MRGHRLGFSLILLPVAALIALLVWASAQSADNPGGVAINRNFGEIPITVGPAPTFSLPLLGGGHLQLEALRGKVVMIDFWSSWCPPCLQEAPVLSDAYGHYAGQEVEFLGVAIWDTADDISEHIEQFQLNYPNTLDSEGRVAINYGVRGVPEKYFIDRNGMLVRKFSGPVSADKLHAIIDELLILGD